MISSREKCATIHAQGMATATSNLANLVSGIAQGNFLYLTHSSSIHTYSFTSGASLALTDRTQLMDLK